MLIIQFNNWSTLSSGFNALAAVTWEDLLKDRVKLTEKQELNVVKLIGNCIENFDYWPSLFIFKAMGYGLMAIAMSFGVGNLGTVLQACMALVGSMVGPLFALFCLGIFFRHTTAPVCLVFC